MKTSTDQAVVERLGALELEVKELRALVELQSLVLKRLTSRPPPSEAPDRPVVIPDADALRTPNGELSVLVGSSPATLRELVGRLAQNDLEELRDGPVDELDRSGLLWKALVTLNEEGTFDEPEALAELVRAHSTAVKSAPLRQQSRAAKPPSARPSRRSR
ncbi:MAG: hypothetical protein SFW67_34375 [Myxococcaceae bacterium]|nr:hypothetical protein [Myxococcaceae bacterium]